MFLSPVVSLALALASADIAADAPPPDPAAEAVAADAAEAAEAENPIIAEVLGGMEPEARAALEAMDPSQLDALIERAQRGEALTDTEQKVVDALGEVAQRTFESSLEFQTGDINIRDDLAVLHLGSDFRYLGPSDAARILTEAWGNPPGELTLGMILPASISPLDPKRGWGVIITYSEEGHVDDDDADDIDYDELLGELQQATEAGNQGRVAQGYPAMHLRGWAEPPHYARDIHSLYWAQELAVDGGSENSLNYAIRVLGRKGVLELNAVSGISQLSAIKPEMEKVYALVEFKEGNRYVDFNPDIDEVAAYGIAGLIAGKVAMKAGLFAGLLKLLIAAKKLIIVLVIGAIAGIKGLLGMKKKKEEA
ncbi:MAG: DUF2167 domain-containing protein [Nannocystaceae bacterium]